MRRWIGRLLLRCWGVFDLAVFSVLSEFVCGSVGVHRDGMRERERMGR